MIRQYINALIDAFIKNNFIARSDETYYRNIVSGVLKVVNKTNVKASESDVAKLFNYIGNYGAKTTNMTKAQMIDFISALLIPAPTAFESTFLKEEKTSALNAWNNFYEKAKQSYYIKYDQIKENNEWDVEIENCYVQITINFPKPEKSPHEIRLASLSKVAKYPQCSICYENIGFFGTPKSNSRQNIRFINKKLGNQDFFMHFSPYGYFDHHLIVNSKVHAPIRITKETFQQQLDFIEKYPFYFIGSNSDLPIVGGSILSHAHFQAGKANFPIFKSAALKTITNKKTIIEMLDWPVSTIRISGANKKAIIEASNRVLRKWYDYSNPVLNIVARKNNKRQNTITTMARFNENIYEMYLMLRNNGTSKEHPEGIFHLHKDKWNIKKENIGLIEAAGKAILSGRLKKELAEIKKILQVNHYKPKMSLKAHKQWIPILLEKRRTTKLPLGDFIKYEVGLSFYNGLKDCGVFYNANDEFEKFVESL